MAEEPTRTEDGAAEEWPYSLFRKTPGWFLVALQFAEVAAFRARTPEGAVGKPCRSPATKKGRCRLHGGANGSGAPPGERNGKYRRVAQHAPRCAGMNM
jgi:hypothetical protein